MSGAGAAPDAGTAFASFAIEVPATRILAAREARLLEIARNLNRAAPPDTVPEAVRSRFAASVVSEVLERTVEAEVAHILAAAPELRGARRVVEELSFQENDGLRFRLRVLPGVPPAPRPGTPTQPSDHAVCSIEASLEEEGPRPGAQTLLLPVSPEEAAAGEPGRLPPGWWQVVPEGISWRVSVTGRDFGVPFVELHYRGVAPAQSQITVRFSCQEEARGVKRLWLEAPWRLASGALPDSCSALLVLGRHGADGAYRDTLNVEMPRPGPMNMVGQRPAAGFEGSEGPLLPGIAVWFTRKERVDFRLRLGMPGLWPAALV